MEIKNSGLVYRSFGENREEAIGEFNVNYCFNEFTEGFRVEFVAGDLSLELPSLAVDGEDSVAEQIVDRLIKHETFTVAREIGFENVLHHGRVSREDLTGAERSMEDEGGGRDGLEDVGDPLHSSVEVG